MVHGTLYNEFHDDDYFLCPRNVVNNRQNFTVLQLPPHCPVIVNGARLSNENVEDTKSNLKWIIVVCVIIVLLLLVIVVGGLFLYLRKKKKSIRAVKSVRDVEQVSKSPITRTPNQKTSLVIKPVEISQVNVIDPDSLSDSAAKNNV
uniref:Uncharacterized protein n=1 Tax=Panagrellus redivivus TaxID=6233 RepID=A0A7E4VNJ7_PANRE